MGKGAGTTTELLFYCRPGFEGDLIAELTERGETAGQAAYPQARPDTGFVRFVPVEGDLEGLAEALPPDALIFARQRLLAQAPLERLSRDDRMTPVVDQLVAAGITVDSVWHELPDTNEGKSLGRLVRALERPLQGVLRKRGVLVDEADGRRAHLFWSRGDAVQIAFSSRGERSEWRGGIPRLRAPSGAPSRSALKLEEAWHTFIPAHEWPVRLAEGMQAVDLGAAPGGWTWELVQRGMYVHAVDNGPMDERLMATTQVEHHREDAFVWEPPNPVAWLVCDIVDKPARVAARIGDWLERQWCREAVFNLKLPMKKRWQTVRDCLNHLDERLAAAGVGYDVRARQLYHDREEVTVHIQLVGEPRSR
ncbi:putative RNA 2'-O-ribose methyltransferase [Thioalkalivibrio sp. K90mix]|uniref:23S rRNA (cytidine(2498)-2'-O)-methyltransferase RlmM n=1 Tax=Thioalkalivibrio sp. (strain K90mix) TaxID=396595 RepID=UPI000195A6A2|nr:23S rRNA (cytidine(2498)-2'-O)-methyltransferase RlmM [Thioalkalivibrio sp. K90mix]ADC71660.1 putative RNA 2'-O-ribose methyltransferase [Thioalkalivibrio sp. K90mix]